MKCRSDLRRLVFSWTAAGLLGAGLNPAGAISITTVYNPGASGGNSVNPSFDPGGTQLSAIFQYVDTYYTDIFENGGHSLTINFWYQDLTNLGDHDWVSEDSNNRENVANIKIDTNVGTGGALRNYFFDTTPADDDEFNMQQTLWRDVNGANRSDWYNFGTSIPDTFEVAFRGAATGGGAVGATDMLSLVLHEVGHALGMSGGNTLTVAETNDGDYDFDPDFVFGRTLAADNVDQATDFRGHLDVGPNQALMFPNLGGGRVRPSHTDLFAMASGNDYTLVDAPRREFYGDSVGDGVGSWNTNAHWSGNKDPDFNDDVFVRAAQGAGTTITAFLTANGVARNLNISEGANVDTGAFKLDIGGDVTITDLDSDVIIDPNGELEADEVFIQNQAEVAMGGGTLDARRVVIDDGTQIRAYNGGSATVQISQGLINNGTLTSTADSLLYFSTTTPTPWDADGTSGNGHINASNGRVWFDTGAMTDAFGGEVTVGAGQFFRFDAPWTVDTGTLDLNGGATGTELARIVGGAIEVTGAARVEAAGQAHIDPNINLAAATDVDLSFNTNLEFNGAVVVSGTDFTLRNGSDLEFDAATTLTGAIGFSTILNINGTGDADVDFDAFTLWSNATVTKSGSVDLVIQQTGDPRYVGTNTVTADVYDMDGVSGNTVLEFGDGVNSGSLLLNVDAVDTSGNTFNGTLDLDNPGFSNKLTVNLNIPTTRWTMAGTANLSGNAFFFLDRIAGTRFNINGTVNVSNSFVSIDADVDVLDNAVINFNSASSNLGFKGFTQITAGADINGAGTIHALAGSELLLLDGVNLPSASLTNSGTLSLLGTGAATVQDFTQTNGGQWNANLAGASSLLYDVLVSDGDIVLDGALSLSLTGGYLPNLYTTTHTLLNGVFGASLSGIFDQVMGVVQNGFGLAVLYTSQDVRVRAALLGDANLNQQVEQGDLDAVLANWGENNFAGGAVSWISGDLNGNGIVEQGDLDQVLANWGDAAAPDFRGFSVPEPTAALVLLTATAWRRQRRE